MKRDTPGREQLANFLGVSYNITNNNKGAEMTITITDTNNQPILAKDIAPSKQTRTQIDRAIASAKRNRPRPALTYLSMADHTQQFIIITIR